MNDKTIFAVLLVMTGMVLGGIAVTVFDGLPPGNAENPAVSEPAAVEETTSPPVPDTEFTQKLNSTFTAIAEEAKPSVVTLLTARTVEMQPFPFEGDPFGQFFGEDFFERFFGGPPQGERRVRGLGSGVVVSEDGYILTNHHVVRQVDEVLVMLERGTEVQAKIVGTDAKTDLAVLKVEKDDLRPVKMGDSEQLKVGEWVVAIGSPLSTTLARTVTAGIVSAKGRSNVGLADYEDFIQTDAAINPGNSGGALINMRGELVGINTAIASRSGGFMGIGFAVPMNMARKVMEALIEHGKVVRGWLGVIIQNIDQRLAKAMDLPTREGALVSSVQENSPADRAGLKTGDVIAAIDGEKVRDVTHLRNEVASRDPGTEVTLRIYRDGEKQEINVTLGQLPEEGPSPAMQKSSVERLGFSVQTLTDRLAERLGYDPSEQGVVISQINPGSAAYSAGLRRGDLIKSVNRQPVATAEQFRELVGQLRPGDTVLVYAKRGSQSFFAAFELPK